MTYHPSKRWDLVEVAVQVHHETSKAWLVSETGSEPDAVWVPKSQCELHNGVLELPQWLAEEKGFFDPVGRKKPKP